jgi:hypothetical protein
VHFEGLDCLWGLVTFERRGEGTMALLKKKPKKGKKKKKK